MTQQALRQAKKFLAKGDFNKTFKVLGELFASDDKYKRVASLLIQYQNQYSKIKEDDNTNVISIADAQLGYNRVTKGLLSLIQKVENNDLSDEVETADANAPTNRQFIPIIIIILVGIVGLFVYSKALKPRHPQNQVAACPSFKPVSKFNILVLPFSSLIKGDEINISQELKRRLKKFSNEFRLNTDVEISGIQPKDKNYPDDNVTAKKVGKRCQANLIIWGTYEKQSADRTIVNTEFQFIGDQDHLNFDEFQINTENELTTIPSISSIAANGSISASIEEQIAMILGMTANQMGENDAAIDLLTLVKTPDKRDYTTTMTDLALADSYAKTKNHDKAIAVYSKILKKDPSNEIALTNRATFSQVKGDLKTALIDTKKLQELHPEEQKFNIKVVQILINDGKLDAAKTEIRKLDQSKIDPKVSTYLKKQYQIKKTNPDYKMRTDKFSTIKKTN